MNYRRVGRVVGVMVASTATLTLLPLPRAVSQSLPHVQASPKRDDATPEQAMRQYLESWMRGDSAGMWQHLSKSTKKHYPKQIFMGKEANSEKKYLKLTRIISVRRLPEKSVPTVAYVSYQVEARITQSEADQLRKAGHPDARPGLWVFRPTRRRMVYEEGRWLIEYPWSA